MNVVVGTAGWSIASAAAHAFPDGGTALERYARVFSGVEINSSFHRSHRGSTWARWAQSVPDGFRFAVKLPKTITHAAKLRDADALTRMFLDEVRPLGDALAVLLVQLPPKLDFDADVAQAFFAQLRALTPAVVACEPRHASWFEPGADALLTRLQISRVAADPAPVPPAATPGGWAGLRYWRLHGSPVMYRSSYSAEALEGYAQAVMAGTEGATQSWCMFDNTAASAATGNALALQARLLEGRSVGDRQ